jgi:hypothetical protein
MNMTMNMTLTLTGLKYPVSVMAGFDVNTTTVATGKVQRTSWIGWNNVVTETPPSYVRPLGC